MAVEHQSYKVYHDPYFDIQAVKILPGEFYVTQQQLMLVTVAGSCVVACIRDKVLGWGGLSHFMLPLVEDELTPTTAASRYGSHALEVLINELQKRGSDRKNLEAKIFGAARLELNAASELLSQRNASFLINYLTAEQIPIVSQSMLGQFPQKVYFFPETGRVLVKTLKKLNNTTIYEREALYLEQLINTKIAGQIEIFTGETN